MGRNVEVVVSAMQEIKNQVSRENASGKTIKQHRQPEGFT